MVVGTKCMSIREILYPGSLEKEDLGGFRRWKGGIHIVHLATKCQLKLLLSSLRKS